jgi:hypothetical protein
VARYIDGPDEDSECYDDGNDDSISEQCAEMYGDSSMNPAGYAQMCGSSFSYSSGMGPTGWGSGLQTQGSDYSNLTANQQQVLGWLPSAWSDMAYFSAISTNSPKCLGDLKAVGFTPQMVQNYFSSPDTSLVDASTYADQRYFQLMQAKGGDFLETRLAPGPGNIVFYDANNFWQGSFYMLLATLLHESLHSTGADDPTLENELKITKAAISQYGSSSISIKLGQDCFGVKQ